MPVKPPRNPREDVPADPRFGLIDLDDDPDDGPSEEPGGAPPAPPPGPARPPLPLTPAAPTGMAAFRRRPGEPRRRDAASVPPREASTGRVDVRLMGTSADVSAARALLERLIPGLTLGDPYEGRNPRYVADPKCFVRGQLRVER